MLGEPKPYMFYHNFIVFFSLLSYYTHIISFFINVFNKLPCLLSAKDGETSPPPLPILPFTIHHRHRRTHKRRHNRRGNNPRRVHTAVLLPVSDHIHWYQLQGRNIQYQKRAHLIAGDTLPLLFPPAGGSQTIHRASSVKTASRFRAMFDISAFLHISRRASLRLQLCQFLHRFQPPLCQVNDTNFLITFLKPRFITC